MSHTSPLPGYRWHLRRLMASRELWRATDLGPLLAERGVTLSAAQLYRLVANAPERLSLPTLAALCDVLACTPNDLIELAPAASPRADPPHATRPRRARVATR